MKIYTYSEARQQLAELLSCARHEGQVEIRRRDGQSFLVQPAPPRRSPLDVPAVESGFHALQLSSLCARAGGPRNVCFPRGGGESRALEPVNRHAAKQLRIKIGRLLRHHAAGKRDARHIFDRRRL